MSTRTGPISKTTERRIPVMLGGRYRLGDRVGEGGFGLVFEAWDVHTGRPVAVKLVRLESDTEKLRWRREVEGLAKLERHPHVLRLYDHGTDEESGYHYLVSELITGSSLDKMLAPARPLPPAFCLRVGSHIAAALAAIHEKNLIHRDVHPGNILVEEGADGPVARLIDFGVIGHADGPRTVTHLSGGVPQTPRYSPTDDPEIGTFTDVFGLGMSLHTALAGLPAGMREMPESIPAEVRAYVKALHHPEHTERPWDAAAVADELRRLEALVGAPSSPGRRPPARRRARLVWVGATLGLTIAAAAWWSIRVPMTTLLTVNRPPEAPVIANIAAAWNGRQHAMLFNTMLRANPSFRLSIFDEAWRPVYAGQLTTPPDSGVTQDSNARSIRGTRDGFLVAGVERSVQAGLTLRNHLFVMHLDNHGRTLGRLSLDGDVYLGAPQVVPGRKSLGVFVGNTIYLFPANDGMLIDGASPLFRLEMPGGIPPGANICFDGSGFIVVFGRLTNDSSWGDGGVGEVETVRVSEDAQVTTPATIAHDVTLEETPSVSCDGPDAVAVAQWGGFARVFRVGVSGFVAEAQVPVEPGLVVRGVTHRESDFVLVLLTRQKTGFLRAYARSDWRLIAAAAVRPFSLDDETCQAPNGQCWPGLLADSAGYSIVAELRDHRIGVQSLELPNPEP